MRIYVASSWRNEIQPDVVSALQGVGHDVYDFRHPIDGIEGFASAADAMGIIQDSEELPAEDAQECSTLTT